jgi:CBS domain-containing protein
MRVSDVLRVKGRAVQTIGPSATIQDAMAILIAQRISCLPVVNDRRELVGIISDKDIFRKAYHDPKGFQGMLVEDLMTAEVIVGLDEDEVGYIAAIMTQNRIRHVPIVSDNLLTGLVSIGDVVKLQMTEIRVENRYLWEYINGSYPG